MLTSFIGREEAVREVAGLLGACRLVTVTGPGGSGKTRLAGQVARLVAGRFTDGAWLAELAAVRDPEQVAAAVAAALGIREQPGTPLADALARALGGQQLLLVLDNCEHVIGAAAELCAGLLAACDEVRVLVTSREPLAVAGEASAETCAPRPGALPRPLRCGLRAPRPTSTRESPIRPGSRPSGSNSSARPGRCWDPPGRGRLRTAARR